MSPKPIQDLVNQLIKLPDIGPRAANRLVFYFLRQDQKNLNELAEAIKGLKKNIFFCTQCFNITENKDRICNFCQDAKRDQNTICIIENVLNIASIENTKQYNGLYHVLGGAISPQNGINPVNLNINPLIKRLRSTKPKEVIFALNPTVEGDTTILYLEKLIHPLGIKMSRLARGLSSGSDLQYIDANTLASALLERK